MITDVACEVKLAHISECQFKTDTVKVSFYPLGEAILICRLTANQQLLTPNNPENLSAFPIKKPHSMSRANGNKHANFPYYPIDIWFILFGV